MRNFRRRLDRTKPLRLDHPVDSHLKPLKDSDGNVCPFEISTDKVRVKDFDVTGTATGTSDDKLPLVGGTMSGALNMDSNNILECQAIQSSEDMYVQVVSDAGGDKTLYVKSLNVGGGDGNIIVTADGISGSAIKDQDTMSSDSATHLASQQSIKAYVDAGDEKGWHGSTTRVKILHGDFIPDDGGRPVQIEDATGGTRRLKSHGTNPMFASVPIPTGYTATAVYVYGSDTSNMFVYEADINSATVTSKGTGNIGTELNITDVESDTTNYILIEVAQGSSEYVYGGYMTIAAS